MTSTLKEVSDQTDRLILDYCKGRNKTGSYDWSCGWALLGKQVAILTEISIFQDDDVLLVFDGMEGAGKSKLMRKIGGLIHQLLLLWGIKSTYSNDNIHFTVEEYIKKSMKEGKAGNKGFINILDEARRELNRTASQSRDNRKFTDYLSECRDMNQIHMVGLPSFHDLDKNIVLFRQRFIVHIKKSMVADPNTRTGQTLKRGKFVCYQRNRDLINSYFSKVRYTYPKKFVLNGIFDDKEPEEIDIKQYLKKKEKFRIEKFKKQREKDVGKRQAKAEFSNIEIPSF